MSRRSQKKRVLKRDDYRCGIHLAGCGKRLSFSETTIGHIVPQVMGGSRPLVVHGEQNRDDRRRLRDVNVQPMCEECNQRMEAIFPMVPMQSRCECCHWVYGIFVRKPSNESVHPVFRAGVYGVWRPVLPSDNTVAASPGHAALMWHTSKEGCNALIRYDSGPRCLVETIDSGEMVGDVWYPFAAMRKDGVMVAGMGFPVPHDRSGIWNKAMGNSVHVPDMLRNNRTHNATTGAAWMSVMHALSASENEAIAAWLLAEPQSSTHRMSPRRFVRIAERRVKEKRPPKGTESVQSASRDGDLNHRLLTSRFDGTSVRLLRRG